MHNNKLLKDYKEKVIERFNEVDSFNFSWLKSERERDVYKTALDQSIVLLENALKNDMSKTKKFKCPLPEEKCWGCHNRSSCEIINRNQKKGAKDE